MFNPHLLNGFSHFYQINVSNSRVNVWEEFFFISCFILNCNYSVVDQTPHSVASDLGMGHNILLFRLFTL